MNQAVTICMIGVIYHLVKDTKKVFIFLTVLFISLLVILALVLPDSKLFGNNEAIYFHDLPNGDNLTLIKGFTVWRALTDLTILLFTFSTYMLVAKNSNVFNRKNAIVFYAGLGLILFTALYDHFVDMDRINSIYLLPLAIFLFYMILNFIPFKFLLEEVAETDMISQQEKKWKNLVIEADVIVVGLNRMGHVEFVNPFFLELTGYDENEVIGKDWFEFFIPSKESYTVQSAFIEILDFEFHPHYYNPVLTKSKEEKMVRWFNVRTRDQNENITGSLSIGVDITEDLREKEEIIKKLNAAQDLIDRLKKNNPQES